jgi:hypothetical protein
MQLNTGLSWGTRRRLDLPLRLRAHHAVAVSARVQPLLSSSGERARRQIVALVFVIYLLAIFEGSLRKWVVPQFSQYLFFVRDPFLLLAYGIASAHGFWPKRSFFCKLSFALCGLGVLLAAVQAMTGGHSDTRLLLAAYGWRSYFMYAPLAFLVGAQFRQADLQRLYKLTLLLAVPIGILVAAQFFSPPGAAINVGSASEQELQFRGLGQNEERTRPMGPFSSGAGQQQFVATVCALLLAFFIAPKRITQPPLWMLLAAASGLMTCVALSGSRGTVLQCGIAVVFAMLVGVLGRGGALKGRALLWPLALAGAAVVLYPVLFPEGFAAFSERWTHAQQTETRSFEGGVFGRALFGLVDFLDLVEKVPMLGYGLGYGGNASTLLKAEVDGVLPGKLAETDFARHMVDLGPLFGMGYIVFRLAFAVWLAAMVLRATRQAPDPLPMLLLSYVGYTVVMGQITGQGAINVYGWLFAGVLIAACNQATSRAPGATPTQSQAQTQVRNPVGRSLGRRLVRGMAPRRV